MSSGPTICKLEFNGPTASPAYRAHTVLQHRENELYSLLIRSISPDPKMRGGLVYRDSENSTLFLIPLLTLILAPILSPWNKSSGTGGSSQERDLTGFAITPSVTGELVGCLAQLELSDPLALNGWIPTSSP